MAVAPSAVAPSLQPGVACGLQLQLLGCHCIKELSSGLADHLGRLEACYSPISEQQMLSRVMSVKRSFLVATALAGAVGAGAVQERGGLPLTAEEEGLLAQEMGIDR